MDGHKLKSNCYSNYSVNMDIICKRFLKGYQQRLKNRLNERFDISGSKSASSWERMRISMK